MSHRAMEVRRLAWAGLEVNAAGQTAVVDLVEDFSRLHGDNPPAEEIPPSPVPATVAAGLLTHLHSDHADVDALGRVLTPTAVVLRPDRSYGSKAEVALIEKAESELETSGLTTRVVQLATRSFTGGGGCQHFAKALSTWLFYLSAVR